MWSFSRETPLAGGVFEEGEGSLELWGSSCWLFAFRARDEAEFWGGNEKSKQSELKLAGDLPGGQSGLVALWCSLLLLSVLIYQCPYFIAVVAPGCHIWRLLHTFITPRVSQPEGWCLCLISKKKKPLPHQTPNPSQF